MTNEEKLEVLKKRILDQLEKYNTECNEFKFSRSTRADGTTTNYYLHLRPYMVEVLFRCEIQRIEKLTVNKCERIFNNYEILKEVIGEDNIDAIGHFRSGIRHFKKYIIAHPEIFKYDGLNSKKILTLSEIVNPDTYLSQMISKINDNTLYIARYENDVCFITSTIKDCKKVEKVNISIDEAKKNSIINEFNCILKSIYGFKNIVNKYKKEQGYNKKRFIKQLNKVVSLVNNNAPDMILNLELVMLMDSLALFMAASKA